MDSHITDILVKCPLFCGMDEENVRQIAQRYFKTISVEKNMSFFSGHEFEKKIMIIIKGKMSVYKTVGSRRVFMSSLGESDVFGMASLFYDSDTFVTEVTSSDRCELLVSGEADFEKLIRENGDAAVNYIRLLSGKIHYLNSKIDMYTSSNVNAKLAGYILDNMHNGTVSMSMTKMAQALNAGRASLYRAFDYLEGINAISKNGKSLTVLDVDKLSKITEE